MQIRNGHISERIMFWNYLDTTIKTDKNLYDQEKTQVNIAPGYVNA